MYTGSSTAEVYFTLGKPRKKQRSIGFHRTVCSHLDLRHCSKLSCLAVQHAFVGMSGLAGGWWVVASVYLSVCMSVCLSVCLFVCLPVKYRLCICSSLSSAALSFSFLPIVLYCMRPSVYDQSVTHNAIRHMCMNLHPKVLQVQFALVEKSTQRTHSAILFS